LKKKLINIWDDTEAQTFFFSERQKKEDLYLGENSFLFKALFEKCTTLDIVSANGGFYKILKTYLKSFNYTGIDTSEEMILRAKKKLINL
jgi:SAM-dependent methyltransferase